ncbi:MAG: hypothetical protein HRT88_00085 [Lentisphaeraceae bacterium]|nr:hypothetical protein [Lentisphaeraceae bacterium]
MNKISLIGLDTDQKFKKIKDAFGIEGYQLLTTQYKNSKQKLNFICSEGHEGDISWNLFRVGERCKTCESIAWDLERKKEKEKEKAMLSNITIEHVKLIIESYKYLLLSKSYKYPEEIKISCSKGHTGTGKLRVSFSLKKICLFTRMSKSFNRCIICDHINRNLEAHKLNHEDKATLYFVTITDKISKKKHPKFGFTSNLEKRFKYPGKNYSVKINKVFEDTSFNVLGLEKYLMIATKSKRIDYDGDTLKGFGGRSECGREGTILSYRKVWNEIVPR